MNTGDNSGHYENKEKERKERGEGKKEVGGGQGSERHFQATPIKMRRS